MLNEEEKNKALMWIKKNVTPHPRKTYNSYVLKHIMQHSIGIYCEERVFSELMIESGFINEDKYQNNFYATVNPEMCKKFYS